MRRSVGVLVSLELNIVQVRISCLNGSNENFLQREISSLCVFCLYQSILRYQYLRFMVPHVFPESMSLFWIIHRPLCEQFRLEPLSAKEIVPIRTQFVFCDMYSLIFSHANSSMAGNVCWLFTILVQTEISQQLWQGFCTDIHDPPRMNPNDFGDPLTFHLAPPSGQNFTSPVLWFMTNTC